jgi:hypothetical protein
MEWWKQIPWKSWLVIFLIMGAAVFLRNRDNRLLTNARADAEAARLSLHNQIVENVATRGQLQGSLDSMLKENTDLRAAYDSARQAAPDVRVVSASRLDTGPLRVQAPVLPEQPRGSANPAPREGPGSPAVERRKDVSPSPPGVSPIPTTAGPLCMLTTDDEVSIAVEQLELQTKAGNILIVGTGLVYRELPHQLLAGGRFRSQLSDSASLALPSVPRWGALALGTCGVGGCGLGAGVLLPVWTLPLVGWKAETLVAASALPSGLQATVGAGVRW